MWWGQCSAYMHACREDKDCHAVIGVAITFPIGSFVASGEIQKTPLVSQLMHIERSFLGYCFSMEKMKGLSI